MTTLTRRPSSEAKNSWQVYYDDVCVGWIGKRAGVPVDCEQWGWRCGFYPGLEPGQSRDGVAETFDSARKDFDAAWTALLPTIPAGAFDENRRSTAWHAWKYRIWDEGKKLSTQFASGRSECFCGASIDMDTTAQHVYDAHMDMATE